jgi:hypothetical protein
MCPLFKDGRHGLENGCTGGVTRFDVGGHRVCVDLIQVGVEGMCVSDYCGIRRMVENTNKNKELIR